MAFFPLFPSPRVCLHPVHPSKQSTASSFFRAVLGGPEREAVQCLVGNSEITAWRYTLFSRMSFRRGVRFKQLDKQLDKPEL
jgi:hypothetical protein